MLLDATPSRHTLADHDMGDPCEDVLLQKFTGMEGTKTCGSIESQSLNSVLRHLPDISIAIVRWKQNIQSTV